MGNARYLQEGSFLRDRVVHAEEGCSASRPDSSVWFPTPRVWLPQVPRSQPGLPRSSPVQRLRAGLPSPALILTCWGAWEIASPLHVPLTLL